MYTHTTVACEINSDNLVGVADNVESNTVCRNLCSEVNSCDYWSYFGPSSFPFVSTCFLFNNCSVLGTIVIKSVSKVLGKILAYHILPQ